MLKQQGPGIRVHVKQNNLGNDQEYFDEITAYLSI